MLFLVNAAFLNRISAILSVSCIQIDRRGDSGFFNIFSLLFPSLFLIRAFVYLFLGFGIRR